LCILFFIIVIVFYDKKMARMKDSYERALSTARQQLQQQMLNNLSYDIIESFGNNLFAVKYNLISGVLTPLQKLTEGIQGALSTPVSEEFRHLLSTFNQSVHTIQKNVLDAKQPVEAMNTDMIDTCRRLRANFADNSFVKNLRNELGRLTDYAPHIDIKGKEYPLGTEKEIMLLWICQEAFNNVIQHSEAKELNVTIHYDQSFFSLNIKDEGIGFDQKELSKLTKNGKGFENMYTAARMVNSQLIVKSQAHKGTSISIRLQTLSN